jgi:hypothetical protein
MATKTNRREERRLTNILMSEFAVYNCTGNYRQALQTLHDVMGVTTDAHLIAEITPTIEWLRQMV